MMQFEIVIQLIDPANRKRGAGNLSFIPKPSGDPLHQSGLTAAQIAR
jgi:hypothetical protein